MLKFYPTLCVAAEGGEGVQEARVFAEHAIGELRACGWTNIDSLETLEDACDTRTVVSVGSDGSVQGILLYYVSDTNHEHFITVTYVDPQYRGRGIFRSMLGLVSDHAVLNGMSKVSLGVNVENKKMNEIMGRCGFASEWVYYKKSSRELSESFGSLFKGKE